MRTGLVLEGGAHRAIYTAGVLDFLAENKITFDGVIGVSAGAIHGCSFVSGQIGRSINYTLEYAADKRYMSFYSLITTGNMVGEQFCYHDLPERLFPFNHENFEKSPTAFYVTCTNLQTGKAEYIRCEELRNKMPYLRASASMPFVSRISYIENTPYLDGGISDSIPLKAFTEMGYDRCVVVQTRVAGYSKKPNKLTWLAYILYRRFPHFIEAIKNRHLMYNEELKYIEQMQKDNRVFVIRPSKNIKISHTEKNKKVLREVYELGRYDAENSLNDLRTFLQKD